LEGARSVVRVGDLAFLPHEGVISFPVLFLRLFDHKRVVPIRDPLTLTLSRWEREWLTPLGFL
jgi:hypothetical protein